MRSAPPRSARARTSRRIDSCPARTRYGKRRDGSGAVVADGVVVSPDLPSRAGGF
jgi:hypothetical protein